MSAMIENKSTVAAASPKAPASKKIQIENVLHDTGNVFKFTLKHINVCYANAIRRMILSEIPICVIKTETEAVNQCAITVNTTRFHNEILKQRLSCIPIHLTDLNVLPGNYVLELDMKNDTDTMMIVTSEHFRIKNKTTENYITREEMNNIYPSNPITGDYVDFCRLRPKISDSIPGEAIQFTAEFSIGNAKENSMFNVASRCTYCNTINPEEIAQEWDRRKTAIVEKYPQMTEAELEFEKKNFEFLDANRIYYPDQFDFEIQSIGTYDNETLVAKACSILQTKFVDLMEAFDADMVPIRTSETTMENSYDITLENEDYTMGKIIEYILYETYYHGGAHKPLSFCGFKKVHPHHPDSIVRIAFHQKADVNVVRHTMKSVCDEAQQVCKELHRLFKGAA